MIGIKKQLFFILIFFGVVVFGAYISYNPHPCIEPLRYSIGRVDTEFGLATTSFHAVIAQAEEPWETAAGRDLFVYDPTADFTVNLIFDERQELTNEARDVREELVDLREGREGIYEQHQALTEQYDREKELFESMQVEYEQELNEYNEDVESWNSKGGAPANVVKELRQRQRDLERSREDLQHKQEEINNLISKINQVAKSEEELVTVFNEIVDVYQTRHGGSREFEQGHATLAEINVYQFFQRSDLRLVLAHELGHTLGIEHVGDPESVMHRLMEEQSSEPIVLTESDLDELTRVCDDASYWSSK
jgi:predicted Zn-dependent protease